MFLIIIVIFYFRPMIDILLSVSNSKKFHYDNLKKNPHHYYWFLRFLGPSVITFIQNCGSAKLFYNTAIKLKKEHDQVNFLFIKEKKIDNYSNNNTK